MKVWIVHWGNYHPLEIIEIFDSFKKAEDFVKNEDNDDCPFNICEWEVK